MNATLPQEFSHLEHLVAEWAIEDGHERYVKRVNSSMDEIQAFYDEVFPLRRGSGRLHRQVRLLRAAARRRREPAQPALLADHRLAGGRAVEAAAGKAFGEHHSDESELMTMELSSAQLEIVDLTPRIGSEIRTDLDTLLSGREAAHIRATLEQRGVVFFRGLEISDEQQVAIAKTLGNIVAERGRGRHLQDLARRQGEPARQIPEGLAVLALRRLAAAATRISRPCCGRCKLSETGGETEFCNTYAAYDDLPRGGQGRHRRPAGGAQRRAIAVLRHPGDELRRDRVLAEVADEGLPDRVDAPVRPQVAAARRDGGLRGRDCRSRKAALCLRAFVIGPPSRSTSTATSGSSATCSSGTTPEPCTGRCRMPSTAAGSCTAPSSRAKSRCSETRHRHAGRHQRRGSTLGVGEGRRRSRTSARSPRPRIGSATTT